MKISKYHFVRNDVHPTFSSLKFQICATKNIVEKQEPHPVSSVFTKSELLRFHSKWIEDIFSLLEDCIDNEDDGRSEENAEEVRENIR